LIGIGITTYGTRKIPEFLIDVLKDTTLEFELIVAKDIKGIAKAKNACLSKLDHLEHIFLFDDDTYPLCYNWHLPYINAKQPHLSMTWGRKEVGRENGLIYYEKPNGCMLYIHRSCLDAVGGFDEAYKGYGGEHQDFSNRVFNAGLTASRYMDIENSSQFIYSMDQHKEVRSSVYDRSRYIPANMKRLKEQWNSKEYKNYK